MSVFEALRESVDLAEFAGRFTELKRSGKTLRGRCPFPDHQDDTPSFHVYQDERFHCFGCRRHGDVTDLWAGVGGIEPGLEAALDLAREYGVELPEQDPEARKRAQERRDNEASYLQETRECHDTLVKHPNVREWWEKRGFDRELQERFLLGSNEVSTAAVIPFWHRGRIKGLIRRKLKGEPKYLYPNAEDFPAGHRPLFVPGPVRAGTFVVEGVVDALAVAALGESVVAVGGTGTSEEQMRELDRISGPLYILPDADEGGGKAAREWVRKLYPKALLCPAEYGDDRKDFGDVFAAEGGSAKERLEALIDRSMDALGLTISEAPPKGNTLGQYRYFKEEQLHLLMRLEDPSERRAALEDIAKAQNLKVSNLRKALAAAEKREEEAVAEQAERDALQQGTFVPEPGTERYERAVKLLECSDILEEAAKDMERLGHVGERATKKLALICALSAKSGRPIQPSTHAQSSAGKNALWDTTLSLLPEEMVVRRSGLTAKALFRTEANLKGSVLYLQEVAGSEDANYSIRVMQSDGRLEYEATQKMPDGSMKNVVYRTEGPTVIVQTTTKNHLHPENETRVFPIYIDESEEQTGRIVESILKDAAGRGVNNAEREQVRERWHDAIRLLEPDQEVVIPYAERVEIPNSPIRIRRDARRLMDVVWVIAWLHQHGRERDEAGCIVATEDNFHAALGLVSESLTRAWQTLTPSEETILRAIKELPEQQRTNGFRRRDLKVPNVSDRRIKEVLKSLTDTGYLDCDGRQGPQGYSYTVAREAEEVSLGISLRPSPDSQESAANEDSPTGREAFARYRPVPDSQEEENPSGLAGENGRNGHRPIEDSDLQEKRATGRTGGGETLCIHEYPGGIGCYVCDPQHPYRLKGGSTV